MTEEGLQYISIDFLHLNRVIAEPLHTVQMATSWTYNSDKNVWC